MLTEKQKREFEKFFDFYSFQKEYNSEWRAEYNFKMFALRDAVKILGYKFEPKGIVNECGIAYQKFELVKINK